MTRGSLARLVCLLTILPLLSWLPVPAAHAAAVTVEVKLTSLRVTGSDPKDQVILHGTVTNNGAQAAFGVHVVLWRSRDPIRDPAVLRSVATGDNVPWGERLSAKPDHYYKITQSTESLDPGRSESFVVRGTLAELGFTARGAAYVFGVQVLGTPDASSNYTTIGKARTFVGIPGKSAVPLVNLVTLTSSPAKLRPNVFADDHLATELVGRLDVLLNAAERSGFSYLIDPALYDEVTDMADGYQVVDGDKLREGTGQSAAQEWLARFKQLPASRGGRTLFANPDVLGAQQAGDAEVLNRTIAATAEITALDDLPLVVLPTGAAVDAATLAYLAPASPKAVVSVSAGGGPAYTRGPRGLSLLRVQSFDETGPGHADGAVERSQRMLAEAVIAGSQLRLITSDQDIADTDSVAPRWLQPRTLGALLDAGSDGSTSALVLPATVRPLPTARFRDLRELADDFTAYAELVPNSVVAPDSRASLSRAASGLWTIPSEGGKFVEALRDAVSRTAISAKVRLTASSRFLMSARTNEFPLTISNQLTEAIRVRVVVVSENPQRLSIPPSGLVTVGPGQSQTVNVRPEASSNGLVNVSAHVVSESGRRVTPNTRITVDVTELGMIGWIIVIASGAVLVGATAWRIRQVRRRADKELP